MSDLKTEMYIPLSPPQQLLEFLNDSRYGGLDETFVTWDMYRLVGECRLGALELAAQDLVRRHTALRSIIARGDGLPSVKVLAHNLVADKRVVVARDLVESEATAALEELLVAASTTHFDRTEPPFIRVIVYSLDEREHLLALVAHHEAVDGWSLGVLAEELGALYAGHSAAEGRRLSGARQYWEYSISSFNECSGEGNLRHWLDRLEGLESTPLRRSAAQVNVGVRASLERRANPERAVPLQELASRYSCSQFTVLLAAHKIALARLTGEGDVFVPVVSAGRSDERFLDTVGFFLNVLPIRSVLGGNPSVSECLEVVKDAWFDALAYQEVSVLEMLMSSDDLSGLLSDGDSVILLFQMLDLPHTATPWFGQFLEARQILFDVGGEQSMVPAEGLVTIRDVNGSLVFGCEYDPAAVSKVAIEELFRLMEVALVELDVDPSHLLFGSSHRRGD